MLLILLTVSFVCYLAGLISWKWPDAVQRHLEVLDGSYMLVTPETHRALIAASGVALIFLSFVILVMAAVRV
jgi:hypothetical protein